MLVLILIIIGFALLVDTWVSYIIGYECGRAWQRKHSGSND